MLIEDRHIDVDVEPFVSVDAAIAYAKEQVQELVHHPEHIEEEDVEGYLYSCRYSVEGDRVSVIERAIHA